MGGNSHSPGGVAAAHTAVVGGMVVGGKVDSGVIE